MKTKKLFTFCLFSCLTIVCFAQTNDLTEDEKKYIQNARSLFEYFDNRAYSSTLRDSVFEKFVYFDNILADSSKTRVNERKILFDRMFPKMLHLVDSVGIKNLVVVPTRFFINDSTYFKHFGKDGELHKLLPFILTYYNKATPDIPMGLLLFEPRTHKLMAWMIINQGGYWYFLTFNLL
ncbi:hypothetical protein [Pedobacter nototheniae]|uniref:hypothetical protein n=1 Tax=Pedobacter nototheniae TaxID=2488994 RepID=UPI00103E8B3D|nr:MULTISPECIES: hypothetical protein [Pedobacter]